MKTPLADFLDRYAASGAERLHMPGHKGKLEAFDVTEIDGADVLYASCGVIRESEENAAALFGAARTFYSAEGSSLCIRAMLALGAAWAEKEKKPRRILALRNVHRSFLSAAALLDLEVEFLLPEGSTLLSCPLTPEELSLALKRHAVFAVFVTSPDYPGHLLPLEALARVCRNAGVLLFCDNAHGAYLRFLPEDRHPMTLGADLCCDSAHKTLPALTGAAYLHVSPAAPSFFREEGERFLSLFASTSPSYLILRSLDLLNRTLSGSFRASLTAFLPLLSDLKDALSRQGFALCGEEPLKVVIAPKSYGYTGFELAAHLRSRGIEPEMADPDVAVLLFSPLFSPDAPEKVRAALSLLPRRAALLETPPPVPVPEPRLSPREAMLSPARRVSLSAALGEVLAAPCVSCPPAVPIAVCGEVLTAAHLAAFAYYGVREVEVVER